MLATTALAAGCYGPKLRNFGFACDPQAIKPCPDGSFCNSGLIGPGIFVSIFSYAIGDGAALDLPGRTVATGGAVAGCSGRDGLARYGASAIRRPCSVSLALPS